MSIVPVGGEKGTMSKDGVFRAIRVPREELIGLTCTPLRPVKGERNARVGKMKKVVTLRGCFYVEIVTFGCTHEAYMTFCLKAGYLGFPVKAEIFVLKTYSRLKFRSKI